MARSKVEVAKRILQDLWAKVIKRHPDMRQVSLRLDPLIHDTPRHFAAYLPAERVILLAPEALSLPTAKLRGLLAHELGHAIVHQTGKRIVKGYDAHERQADREAEKACGLRIRYGSDGVQSAGRGARGSRRPAGLR